MIHKVIINDFQIDLFIKLMKNSKITKYTEQEKEEMDDLIECLQSIKDDKIEDNLNDLTGY